MAGLTLIPRAAAHFHQFAIGFCAADGFIGGILVLGLIVMEGDGRAGVSAPEAGRRSIRCTSARAGRIGHDMKPVFGFVMLAGLLLFGADGATDAAKKKMAAGKYEEAVTDLDAAYQKNPKSAELKKALAGAHFAQGEATMKNEQLPPMRKYPAALRAFRKTVALDPAHAGAKDNIKAIEDVYKSMGRPVPQ